MLTHLSLVSSRSPTSPKGLGVNQPGEHHITGEGNTKDKAIHTEEGNKVHRSLEEGKRVVVGKTGWGVLKQGT